MKVVVTKKLYVRVGSPSLLAPRYQYLSPGSELEVDGKLYKGDTYKGNDTWMKDEAGNYYWIGGLDYLSKIEKESSDPTIINYHELINIPPEYKSYKGSLVKIGIVDTGCSAHPALKSNILTGWNFLNNTSDYNDISSNSHGTFVAGLIAAKNIEGAKMIGMAPEAKLIIAKISDWGSIDDSESVLKALNWLVEQEVNIINLSLSFYAGDLAEKFNYIFELIAKKKIIIVAAGNDNDGLYEGGLYYPSSVSNNIAVGSVSRIHFEKRYPEKINSKIKFLMEELDFTSSDKYNEYSSGIGSSFATAITSGTLGLLLSNSYATKKIYNPVSKLSELVDNIKLPEQLENKLKIFKL